MKKVMVEKEAEDFLEENGFKVVKRGYVSDEGELEGMCKKIGFPLVMKVSGKKIIHKNPVNGVEVGIKSYDQALKAFKRLMKIKGAGGVLVQKQMKGKEFIIGLKKTPEFGHVIVFGVGGVRVEKIKKVSFRVCGISQSDIKGVIKDVNVKVDNLGVIEKNILKLCKLSQKFPKIKELDINPLIVNFKEGVVVDARVRMD